LGRVAGVADRSEDSRADALRSLGFDRVKAIRTVSWHPIDRNLRAKSVDNNREDEPGQTVGIETDCSRVGIPLAPDLALGLYFPSLTEASVWHPCCFSLWCRL